MAQLLSKADGDVQKALTAIDSHLSSMQQAQTTANEIESRVRVVFNLQAGVAFCNQINSWRDSLTQVMGTFQNLQADLRNQSHILDTSNDTATNSAHGWQTGVGAHTYAALTPNS
jgi:hypothetical protein